MHPVVRLRWKHVIPKSPASVEQIDVPSGSRRLKNAAVTISQPPGCVPILLRAAIAYQCGPRGYVVTLRAQLRNPDDEGHKSDARLVSEDRLLNFERPSKTKPSSRADEQHDTNLVAISIECRAQWCAAYGDVGEPHVRDPACASTQEHRCIRSKEKFTLHRSSLVKKTVNGERRRGKP
jgi:hypothetical protein